MGGNALIPAATMCSVEAVRLLHEANIDPTVKVFPGIGVFKLACAFAGVPMIKELMMRFPDIVKLRFCLHTALAFHGGIRTVSFLLEASADVNEAFAVQKRGWWLILQLLRMRHWLSPSALTFDSTPLLLSAGARLDLRNARGKTALDMARETGAPASIVSLAMGTRTDDGKDSDSDGSTIEI
eukprot:Skav235785  [mRNA]  locus=scaffold7679:4157:6377:- [translate_table: standard]